MENKRLFIDDFEIESKQNLKRRFHPPEKVGTVLQPDQPWEDKSGCACPMVIRDPEGTFKMWYWNSKGDLNDLYATSEDGLHWEKPILHLAEIDGNTENNKVKTPGRIGPGAVFYCPESIPSEGEDTLYRTVSWIPGGEWSQRYLPIFSPDGFTWDTVENADEEPGLSDGVGDTGTFLLADDAFPMIRDDVPGRYIAFPRLHATVGHFRRRAVGMTFANSLPNRARLMLDWPRPNLVLAPDLLDDEMARERLDNAYAEGIIHYNDPVDQHCEFYTMQPWTVGNVFLGALYIFDVSMDMNKHSMWNQHGIMETQLVYSRDLVHWDRLGDRQPWIGRGEAGEQDCAMIHFDSVPIRVGDWMYQYYSSGNLPHPSVDQQWLYEQRRLIEAGKRHPLQAIGCVRFRPDRYISLEAGNRAGRVTTKESTVSGGTLRVNVDATDGELTVTVLTERGRPLKGYERSQPIRGDHIEAAVSFSKPLADLVGKRVKLRFTLQNAKLFSYSWDKVV